MAISSNELRTDVRFLHRPYFLSGAASAGMFARATAITLVVSFLGQASAAPINYGDFPGNSVTYVGVMEDSNSGDTPPLFGMPSVSGDSLDFDPVGFSASATGSSGVDVTDGNLRFSVVSNFGNKIFALQLTESGDTTLAGFGTNSTFTSVTGTGILNVNEVDGVGINVLSVPFSMAFSPSGGNYELQNDGGGGPLFSAAWSGFAVIDIDAILTLHNIPFVLGATKISVNLDNTLVALSEAGTFALIAKKDFGGLSISVIPEPSTTLLAIVTLSGLIFVRPRH